MSAGVGSKILKIYHHPLHESLVALQNRKAGFNVIFSSIYQKSNTSLVQKGVTVCAGLG